MMITKNITLLLFIASMSIYELNAQDFTASKTADGIEIAESGKKVLFYQVSPKSLDGKYARAGYVHPLYNLSGDTLTEDMPADHLYHHGIFWAWHQIILDGKKIADGWTSENISYQPINAEIKKKNDKIDIVSEIKWLVPAGSADIPIVTEKTTITVFKSTNDYRIIDFNINLFPLKDGIELGGSEDAKGYGGFCLRLKLPADISFSSLNGSVTPAEQAVNAGPWMNIGGSFNGVSEPESSIAIFGYTAPNNNQHPWILRSTGSMQNVPYPGRKPVPLAKTGLHLKYRIVIQKKQLNLSGLEKLFNDFAHE